MIECINGECHEFETVRLASGGEKLYCKKCGYVIDP